MKHLFQNYEGEIVAADTVEQAAHWFDCEMGGAEKPSEHWSQIPDEANVPIVDEESNETETCTASEWASYEDEITHMATCD